MTKQNIDIETAPPAPVNTPDESEKGDIAGWLRRRAGNDLVMIPGRLAGEIADHIEKLAVPVSTLALSTAMCTLIEEGQEEDDGGAEPILNAIEELKAKLANLPADWDVDSSLETWFPFTAAYISELETRVAQPITDAKDIELALDLLATVFRAYENGISCHEMSGGEEGEYIGSAVRLDYETSTKCADLLNRLRPIKR